MDPASISIVIGAASALMRQARQLIEDAEFINQGPLTPEQMAPFQSEKQATDRRLEILAKQAREAIEGGE